MIQIKLLLSKYFTLFRIVFSLIWLTLLSSTDSYFSIYVLIAFCSFYLLLKREAASTIHCVFSVFHFFLSVLFSGLVLLANYPVFTSIGDPALIGRSTSIIMNLINGLLAFVGGVCVFYPLVSFFLSRFPFDCSDPENKKDSRYLPWFIFGSLLFINLIHLFLVEYPGNLTEDSFTQISEMISGRYSNFNTYWHTMMLQAILTIGYGLFHDINAAVALFTVLQMILLTGAFTYCLMTLYHYGVPKSALWLFYLIYALVPYNLALSITVWKDVLFAASTLLLLCSWFRIMKGIGHSSLYNYIIFSFGSLIFFLSRANGWFIYLAAFFAVLACRRKNRMFLAWMGSFAVLGWFLLNPALTLLGVSGGDPVESFSIPIQQVSRVISDGCDISEEDEHLLSRIVDLEEVPSLYTSWISDPMKAEIRSKDPNYLIEHLGAYGKLWIRLGMKYPWSYVKAWVDQTKGYWNGGYDYFMYSETITDNPYGAEKTGGGNPIASLFRFYFGLSRHLIFFEPLHSIGLHIWILILCFILNLKRGVEQWVLSVPLLVLVVGLWAGTPVYSCFRYVYPIFVSMPLILSTALWKSKNA